MVQGVQRIVDIHSLAPSVPVDDAFVGGGMEQSDIVDLADLVVEDLDVDTYCLDSVERVVSEQVMEASHSRAPFDMDMVHVFGPASRAYACDAVEAIAYMDLVALVLE